MSILAKVPEKEKETPVLGQVSSEVDGLTRPSSHRLCGVIIRVAGLVKGVRLFGRLDRNSPFGGFKRKV
jgi:hypothetical protein